MKKTVNLKFEVSDKDSEFVKKLKKIIKKELKKVHKLPSNIAKI